MAERPRMTAAQLADKLISQEHADVLLESEAWIARELGIHPTELDPPRPARPGDGHELRRPAS